MSDLPRQDLADALERLEFAAIDLGRSQAERGRGNKERERVQTAYRALWTCFEPFLRARQRQVRYTRRRIARLLAALISL